MSQPTRLKYPRTPHLPFSPGVTSDDKVLKSVAHLEGQEVIITEKLDGENTSIYGDGYLHARSVDGRFHPSRSWVKNQIVPLIANQVSATTRVCGENVYAKHSLEYTELSSYFYAFSIWELSTCLSWADTEEFCEALGLELVPVLYRGKFTEKLVRELANSLDLTKQEGLVVRTEKSFSLDDFSMNVAKFVRPGHVQTDEHWAHQTIIPNKLRT